jgi:hypothetical protein
MWRLAVPLSPLFQSNGKSGYTQNCEKRLLASSCPPVCPSVRLSVRMAPLGPNWTDFHEIWYRSIFRKSIEKSQVSWKSDKNNGYFTWRPIYIWSYLAHFFLEWQIFRANGGRENRNSHLCSITFCSRKSCFLWDNVVKDCRAGQATDDKTAHAYCMLDY